MLEASVSLQIALAAETHLADGLTLKMCLSTKVEKSVIFLVGKLTVSNMEEQLILLYSYMLLCHF
jgi:hypothetical protein